MTDMIIAVRNKLPEVPRGLFLVGENTGQTIRFDFDDEWSDYSTKTARVCIGNTRTDIDFIGNTVELPLIPSSIRYIDVGVYAGDLCTTAPARIRVIPSILGISAGSGQYDPDSPNVLPTATEVTLDDLFRLNDVSAGRWVKATVRQLLEAAGAAPQPSDDDPAANGEASPGESDEYSRADHVHPTDSALAERISDIESQKDVWDAKYGPDLGYGTIPEEALDTSTRIKIARGGIALEGLADKVDKIEGKGLSTNDYDNAAKTKVDAIPANPKYTDTVYDDTALAGRVTAIENGAVRHDISQDISDSDKATARTNIGAGTYSKPNGGIPASDLASGVIPAVPSASSATPQALGTAAAGSSADYSRADHVHKKPTARDIGAIAAPANTPSSGDVLTYDGIAWSAESAPTDIYWCTYGTTTNAEIETAYSAGKLVCVKYDGRVYVLVGRGSATSHSFSIPYYVSTPAIYSVHCSGNVWNASSKILIGAPSSPSTGDTLVYDGSAWVAQNNAPKYTTLTLATSDWETSGNDYVCSKTVTGMTATSIVWLAYSDTETEFTEAQSANTLTFTVSSLPAAAITVNVAFMEGSAT